jgi:(1->4)-alpha-D-glucan 1-alpha-D-glucosylmutase
VRPPCVRRGRHLGTRQAPPNPVLAVARELPSFDRHEFSHVRHECAMSLPPRRTPGATYRLQFNKDFTFRHAASCLDYLHELGITDVYASPFFAARAASMHGYDVVDPGKLNSEIGSEADLERLHDALKARGMGLILDLVPNHMCVNTNDNVWWNDVLENGPSSAFAKFFDIDWRPPKPELKDKVLLPVLGDQYGRVLENGDLKLMETQGSLWLAYGERRFPLGPGTYATVLEGALARLRETSESSLDTATQLESLITASHRLPKRSETDAERVRERQREKEILKTRLHALLSSDHAARSALDAELRAIGGSKGVAKSFDKLEVLLAQQAYRLSFWRVAAEHINYRRFFEVNDLAAVRMEEPEVFQAVHAKAFELIGRGWVTGLRIDHVDGLMDPKRYLKDVATAASVPYVVVEKILSYDERLPADWATDGTTGYEFLNALGGVFVSQPGEKALRSFYDDLRTVRGAFGDVVYESKRSILENSMSSEVSVLARRLDRISEQHRWSRDFTIGTLQQILVATIACFPVYRTYVAAGDADVSAQDAEHIRTALADAKRRSAQVSASAFDFLGEVLLVRDPDGLTDPQRAERRSFVLRFQELTGPVAAKGVEDTAFFRYFPLLSLNEVGGGPGHFGASVEEFHQQMEERSRAHPAALSATSTHDTKRAEDNRARLAVISEIPEAWIAEVREWRTLAESFKTVLNGEAVPDADSEYYIYQTIVGAWPPAGLTGDEGVEFSSRVQGAIEKAMREAKRTTSWIHPNSAYEDAIRTFVSRILDPNGALRPRFSAFVSRILRPGLLTSLSQLAIKITAPGVPDFFQGTELWDFSMVDPDNRRPVEFGKRRDALRELGAAGLAASSEWYRTSALRDFWRAPEDGRAKLFVTRALLIRRMQEGELFAHGAYCPMVVEGKWKNNVVAFARRWENRISLTIAGRFFAEWGGDVRRPPLHEAWGDTTVRVPREWGIRQLENALSAITVAPSDDGLRVADVFEALPVAVLIGDGSASALRV